MLQFKVIKEKDPECLKKGANLFKTEISFLKGVVNIEGLPLENRIEICLAGRSNVGKSSLINALVSRKSLARTSNTPGRTQEINFFQLGTKYYLVDLPGYGYANAPLNIIDKWQSLIKEYLTGRVTLRRVFLLIDSRHGIKSTDEGIMNLLDKAAVSFQVVMTKTDKASAKDLENALINTKKSLRQHPAAFPEIILTSANSKQGIDIMRTAIACIG